MDANVKLSAKEMALVTNADFILTKQAITHKLYLLFGALSDRFRELTALPGAAFPATVTAAAPKIYKGEQYQGLPYVMLDYPRCFAGGQVCAIRCFFLWGHSLSIHLHLSGMYKQPYTDQLAHLVQSGELDNWYYCMADNEWQHHFGSDNYRLVSSAREACGQHVYAQHFIKLAQKIPLQEWDHAYEFYVDGFSRLMQVFQQITTPR